MRSPLHCDVKDCDSYVRGLLEVTKKWKSLARDAVQGPVALENSPAWRRFMTDVWRMLRELAPQGRHFKKSWEQELDPRRSI
jgi:hypothetical protein